MHVDDPRHNVDIRSQTDVMYANIMSVVFSVIIYVIKMWDN